MEMHYYGRDAREISLEEWAKLLEDPDGRRVAKTEVATPSGQKILVSTVLIGLDMNYTNEGPPILFETMTFDDSPDIDQNNAWRDIETRRYATEAEALRGHAEIVSWLESFGYEPTSVHIHRPVSELRRAILAGEALASTSLDGGTFSLGPQSPPNDENPSQAR